MRWQRFFLLLIVGLVLSVGLACGQFVQAPQASESPSSAPVAPAATASPLPPETQVILASAGPAGLYNPSRGDVRLVVISDLNSAYGSTDYDPEVDKGINLLPFWQPDLVLCSGDMVAGQKPSLTPAQIRAMWAAFDQHVAAPLRQAQIPFGFTVGNHDASSALSINGEFLFQQERELASAYWNDPNHDPGVQFVDRFQFPFYYSFEYNDIFFLAWDGSSNQIPPEKLAWVEQTLDRTDAFQLIGHPFVHLNDVIQGIGDFASYSRLINRHANREVSFFDLGQCPEKLFEVEAIGIAGCLCSGHRSIPCREVRQEIRQTVLALHHFQSEHCE
ncbi:metallophosphoesterase [Leptolyngbya sp. 7M]|nr:metallophosphoesterase [Leptolyngbya sp. 7M]